MSHESDHRPPGMITSAIHRAVSIPAVYDAVQIAAGSAYAHRRIRAAVASHVSLPDHATVADVGGGTGRARTVWPPDVRYVLVDSDPIKIAGFRQRRRPGEAICADAAGLPFDDGSVDAVLLECVVHHLPPGKAEVVFRDIRRVLKPQGRVVLFDPVWRPRRPIGRVLWRFDRGSFPRRLEELEGLLGRDFEILGREEFSILHHYALMVGRPRP